MLVDGTVPCTEKIKKKKFACLLANKTPVLLNWTTGPANLQHAITFLGIKIILTSQRFIDRVGISVENTQFIFLEKAKSIKIIFD